MKHYYLTYILGFNSNWSREKARGRKNYREYR